MAAAPAVPPTRDQVLLHVLGSNQFRLVSDSAFGSLLRMLKKKHRATEPERIQLLTEFFEDHPTWVMRADQWHQLQAQEQFRNGFTVQKPLLRSIFDVWNLEWDAMDQCSLECMSAKKLAPKSVAEWKKLHDVLVHWEKTAGCEPCCLARKRLRENGLL